MTQHAVIHCAEIPIDDQPHGIDLTGEILHAAIRRPGAVDVWYQARRDQSIEHMRRSFQVVATGQPIPSHLSQYIGHKATAISPDGQLVWHVLENYCLHPAVVPLAQDLSDRMPGVCQACNAEMTGNREGLWTPR